jgi:PadR family transcriptional regulator AphA
MSLRHAVLGLLAVEPATGYELTRKFERSLGNAWHASHSQIYPELARLADAGWVEVLSEGARGSRTYAVTPEGREELRRWLVEVEPSRVQRNESAVRLFFTPRLLDPDDARVVLERDLAYVKAQRAFLEELDRMMRERDEPQPFHPSVDLGLRMNQVTQEWLRDQLASLDHAR